MSKTAASLAIISGINTKGLISGAYKHSKGGATVQGLMNEISFYDINAFSTVILYVDGNDAARGKDQQFMEEKYQQLIGLIKSKNSACLIILCTVTMYFSTAAGYLRFFSAQMVFTCPLQV